MCKTQLWGRKRHGQRVCGKPKFHALWKSKSQIPSLKTSAKRLTHTKQRNLSPSFSKIKMIKLNLNLAVPQWVLDIYSPILPAGHSQTQCCFGEDGGDIKTKAKVLF